jgi:hypothetical protein
MFACQLPTVSHEPLVTEHGLRAMLSQSLFTILVSWKLALKHKFCAALPWNPEK